jgi:hypothetical protein
VALDLAVGLLFLGRAVTLAAGMPRPGRAAVVVALLAAAGCRRDLKRGPPRRG